MAARREQVAVGLELDQRDADVAPELGVEAALEQVRVGEQPPRPSGDVADAEPLGAEQRPGAEQRVHGRVHGGEVDEHDRQVGADDARFGAAAVEGAHRVAEQRRVEIAARLVVGDRAAALSPARPSPAPGRSETVNFTSGRRRPNASRYWVPTVAGE